MNKLTFENIQEDSNASANDIAWHNLKVADDNLHLTAFIGASTGWIRANPGKNFQDLEKELRVRNFKTHLIAKPNPNIPDTVLRLPLSSEQNDESGVEYKYQCLISCRPAEAALQELSQFSGSYDENFDKLKYAGVICGDNFEDEGSEEYSDESEGSEPGDSEGSEGSEDEFKYKTLNEEQRTQMDRLSNNQVKIGVEKVDAEQFIKEMAAKLALRYENVSTAMLGMGHDGSPIFAFVSGTEIISPFGFTITATENGKEYRILKLR